MKYNIDNNMPTPLETTVKKWQWGKTKKIRWSKIVTDKERRHTKVLKNNIRAKSIVIGLCTTLRANYFWHQIIVASFLQVLQIIIINIFILFIYIRCAVNKIGD